MVHNLGAGQLMLLVDETQILISGQTHARYPYGVGVARARGSTLLTRLLTHMRLIAVNCGMLYPLIT